MPTTMETAILVTGALAASFVSTMKSADKHVDAFREDIQKTQQKLRDLERFTAGESNLEKRAKTLQQAQEKLLRMQNRLAAAQKKSGEAEESLTRKRDEAQVRVEKLARELDEARQKQEAFRKTLEASGVSIDKITEHQDEMRRSLERLTSAQEKAEAIEKKRQRFSQAFASGRNGLMATAATAYMLSNPIQQALEAEMVEFYVGTVAPSDDREGTKSAIRRAATETARQGVTGYNQATNLGYMLLSAGFSRDLAEASVPIVASTAKITQGDEKDVAAMLATSLEVFQSRLKGTDSQNIGRMADLFMKTQFKYQIANMGQLNEGFLNAAATIQSLKISPEAALMMIGRLNKTLPGGSAGTGFNAMLRGIMTGTENIQVDRVYDKEGRLDVMATLGNIKRMTRGMNADQLNRFAQELAGDEGNKALIPLLEAFEQLDEELKDVAEDSKGIRDRNMQEYLKTTSARVEAMKNSLSELARATGKAFGPSMEVWTARVAGLAQGLSDMAEEHPKLMNLAADLIVGALGLKGAFSIGKMVFGGFGGAFTMAQKGLSWYSRYRALSAPGRDLRQMPTSMKVFRTAASFGGRAGRFAVSTGGKAGRFVASKGTQVLTRIPALAGKAIAALGSVGKAMTVFMMGPHGLMIAGIVAGAAAIGGAVYLIYKNWDWIASKLTEIWASIQEKWEGLKDNLSKIPKAFGIGGKLSPNDPDILVNNTKGLPKMARGGYVGAPTIAMIGEKGPEMVVPLSDRKSGLARLAQAAQVLMPQSASGGPLTDRLGALIAAPVNNSNAAKAQISVSYSPTIILQGGGDRRSVSSALSAAEKDLRRMLEDILHERERTALA